MHYPDSTKEDTVELLSTDEVKTGQWFWLERDGKQVLFCCTRIGSNYVRLTHPRVTGEPGWGDVRYHFNELHTLRRCDNPEEEIRKLANLHQANAASLMEQAKELTQSLGLTPSLELSSQSETKALVLAGGNLDAKQYEAALIKAQKETLPAIFKAIEKENVEAARWLGAETLPLLADIEVMKSATDKIEDRVFNVSLYAGLTENLDEITSENAKPAAVNEKLRIMQRRLYMDEESLLDYDAGGMEFNDILEFDAWLARPKNRDRILPFPRCIVSMRVRRNEKERFASSFLEGYVNFRLAQADTLTFLYIRNGEKLHRMDCDLDFGEMLFPDKAVYDPSQPMMFNKDDIRYERRNPRMMSLNEYEDRVKEYEKEQELSRQWKEENPEKDWWRNPHDHNSSFDFTPSHWESLDSASVYFDDAMSVVAAEVRQYNRIALIVQGLFDRSLALHPHAPVKTWDPDSFNQSIELVYDSSNVLHYREAPNIDAYMASLNAQINAESVVMGQFDYWLGREAEKENNRRRNSWHYKEDECYITSFKPWNDPGPVKIGNMDNFLPRSRKATFVWFRERKNYDPYKDSNIRTTLTVPADELFNVSAYKPGDYLQFFQDPRTREKYLQWAPDMLRAEKYHAEQAALIDELKGHTDE